MKSLDIIALPQFEKEIIQLARKYPTIENDYANLLIELQNNPLSVINLEIIVIKLECVLLLKEQASVVAQG
jgi:septum formation topological specificity factor MinE